MAKIYSDDAMGALRELLEEDLMAWPDVAVKKMFGCPGYRRGGTLFAFLRDDAIVLLLSPEARAKWTPRLGGGPFTYPSSKGGEMVMEKWYQVPFTDEGDLDKLIPAIKQAYDVSALKGPPAAKAKGRSNPKRAANAVPKKPTSKAGRRPPSRAL